MAGVIIGRTGYIGGPDDMTSSRAYWDSVGGKAGETDTKIPEELTKDYCLNFLTEYVFYFLYLL